MSAVPLGAKAMIVLSVFWTWLWKNMIRAFVWAFVVLVSASLLEVEVTTRVVWLLVISGIVSSFIDKTIFPTPSNLPWKKRHDSRRAH